MNKEFIGVVFCIIFLADLLCVMIYGVFSYLGIESAEGRKINYPFDIGAGVIYGIFSFLCAQRVVRYQTFFEKLLYLIIIFLLIKIIINISHIYYWVYWT
jgi:hypothetical protein